MNVLRNYKIIEDSHIEEYPLIKILQSEEVFVELPVCQVEYGKTIKNPYLFVLENKLPMALEPEQLRKIIQNTKRFFLKVDADGVVSETSEEAATIAIRLPRDTQVKDLVVMNGQVFKREVIE